MAAEYLFIWWDELDGKDMPNICIACGKKAKWYGFSLTQKNLETGSTSKRETLMPLCSKHKGAFEAVNQTFVNLSGCNDAGLWIFQPNKEFVESLAEHREKEIEAWKQENKNADPDDFEQDQLPPGLRKVPEKPTWIQQATKNPMVWVAGGLIAVVLTIMLCGVCGMFGMMMIPLFMR
jgi:hypothetical protein